MSVIKSYFTTATCAEPGICLMGAELTLRQDLPKIISVINLGGKKVTILLLLVSFAVLE